MEFVYNLVLVLHFIGVASLLGGAMVQLSAKLGVKMVVVLVVTVLCWMNRRKATIPDGLFFAVFGLSFANVVIAVFWS